MTPLTSSIVEAAKNIQMSQELKAYFDQWLKNDEIILIEVNRYRDGLLEDDIKRLFDHCSVMATIGMVCGRPELVEKMILKAFNLLNHENVTTKEYFRGPSICACLSAETFATQAHNLGFDETSERIIARARCPSNYTEVKRIWEISSFTPKDLINNFVEYAPIRAENILKRLQGKSE